MLFCGFSLLAEIPIWVSFMGWFIGNEMYLLSGIVITLGEYLLPPLLGLAFLYHTFELGLRSLLTGHAPWSNGYEALLLIAWGGLLAGFSFVRYSKITTAATAVLASIILMVAGLQQL